MVLAATAVLEAMDPGATRNMRCRRRVWSTALRAWERAQLVAGNLCSNESPPHLDVRDAGAAKVLRHVRRVERGGHDDQAKVVGPARQNALEQPQQHVRVDRPLMRLVQENHLRRGALRFQNGKGVMRRPLSRPSGTSMFTVRSCTSSKRLT